MMTLWILLGAAFGALLYRIGLADGLSAARRGRLAGGSAPKEDRLLSRIEAYDGRKERHDG